MPSIKISSDTFLIVASVSVSGVSVKTDEIRDDKEGAARETERNVTRRIENEQQFKSAKEIEARVRALVTKYTTHTTHINLTDLTRLNALRADLEPVLRDADIHNTNHPLHRLTVDFISAPINLNLDAGAAKAIFRDVQQALIDVRAALVAKDIKFVSNWLNRRKNLSALMPEMVATIIDDAMASVRTNVKLIKLNEKENQNVPLDLVPLDSAISWASARDTNQADAASAVH